MNRGYLEWQKKRTFPELLKRGKTYFSRKHVDAFFSKTRFETGIAEWYSADEIRETYKMTLAGVYHFVSDNAIPKKKEGRTVYRCMQNW